MYEATIDNTLLFQTTTGRGDLRSQFLSADGNTLIADSEIYGPIFYFPVYFWWGPTCILGLSNDLIDGGQLRA